MSYCVNCGVELAAELKKCPLCGVAVVNPVRPAETGGLPPYPPEEERCPSDRRQRAAVLTVALLLLIPLLSSFTCDFAFTRSLTWSRYVAAGYLILYSFIFPPLLIRRHPVSYSMLVQYVCLSLALWLLCHITGGLWFWGFALPLVTVSSALAYTVYLLVRHTPWNMLKVISATLGGIGLFTLFVEWLINTTFYSGKPLLWSLITVIPCVVLSVVCAVIDTNRELKQSIKRRCFF